MRYAFEDFVFDTARRELTWLAVPYPVDDVLARLRAAGAPAALLAGQRQYIAGELEPMRRARAEHEAWSQLNLVCAAPPGSGS